MTRLQKMQSENLSYRFGGILECIDDKNLSDEEVSVLQSLKQDERWIAGRKISSYARAALRLLDIEALDDDIDAIDLVNSFLQ